MNWWTWQWEGGNNVWKSPHRTKPMQLIFSRFSVAEIEKSSKWRSKSWKQTTKTGQKNNKRQTHAAYSIGQASRISMQIDGPVHGEGCNVTWTDSNYDNSPNNRPTRSTINIKSTTNDNINNSTFDIRHSTSAKRPTARNRKMRPCEVSPDADADRMWSNLIILSLGVDGFGPSGKQSSSKPTRCSRHCECSSGLIGGRSVALDFPTSSICIC